MLGDMLGLEVNAHNSLARAWQILDGLSGSKPSTALLSIGDRRGPFFAGNRFAPRLPVSLAAVIATIAAGNLHPLSSLAGHSGPRTDSRGTSALERIPRVSWSEFLALVPVSASCFVMIVAQSAATRPGFRFRGTGRRVDGDADILGLAAAKKTQHLVRGTFVVNGSPTQTAMAEHVGARSQVAQVVLSAAVAARALVSLGTAAIPAAVRIGGHRVRDGVGMIDAKGLYGSRRESPGEFYLAVVTAAAVVAIGVKQGILLAIALSLFRTCATVIGRTQ